MAVGKVDEPARPAPGMSATGEERALVAMTPRVRLLATLLLMSATVMVVLDQTIAAVALPQMQATLGATPDTISWVLTSYVVAGAVAMPMTGWLTGRYGRTRLFGVCIIIFTLSSTLCGMAVSLPMMVAARIVQGFSGAFLMPMSQAFLYDMNPPSQQVRAVSIWAMGTMIGPMLGPVVGGYITSSLSWRWVFFINLPIGLVTAVLYFVVMPAFPTVRRAFDGLGFVLIAIALCSLQLVLDRGTQQDWFESTEIAIESCIAVAFFWMAFFHLRRSRNPIIAISLFANRNFAVAMLIGFFLVGVVLSWAAIVPALYVNLLGYPVTHAGLMMVPRGIATTFALFLGARLLKVIDGRVQIFVGLLMVIFALWLETGFALAMGNDLIIIAGVIDGTGSGLVMTVLGYLVVSSAPVHLRTEASAMFTLIRNTGISMAIATFSALLVYNSQVNHAELGAVLSHQLPQLSDVMAGSAMGQRIASMANAELTRQAMMIAYINDFWLMMWALIFMLPIVLLLSPVRAPRGAAEPIAVPE